MTKKELAEILKYSSPREIYIISYNNLLIRLVCPFKVQVIHEVGLLRYGQIVLVDEIKVTLELKTVYVIQSKAYYYYYFDIVL